MHAAHGCFVKARPARPVSAPAVRANRHQRFNRREDENARGTAQTHRAEDWKQPWRTRRNAPRPRATGAATSGWTVIEMQEYMGASRSKAYDLIWPGEIDSYRLGRKLLVSRASVDAYIESRSGRK